PVHVEDAMTTRPVARFTAMTDHVAKAGTWQRRNKRNRVAFRMAFSPAFWRCLRLYAKAEPRCLLSRYCYVRQSAFLAADSIANDARDLHYLLGALGVSVLRKADRRNGDSDGRNHSAILVADWSGDAADSLLILRFIGCVTTALDFRASASQPLDGS